MIIEAPSKSFILSGLVLTSLSKGTVGESSILLPKSLISLSTFWGKVQDDPESRALVIPRE
jgi:hypothetical protein